jgi:hypothetical protein
MTTFLFLQKRNVLLCLTCHFKKDSKLTCVTKVIIHLIIYSLLCN